MVELRVRFSRPARLTLEVELSSLPCTGTCRYTEEPLRASWRFTRLRSDTFRFVPVRNADEKADEICGEDRTNKLRSGAMPE